MGDQQNRETIERLFQCLNDRQVEVMDELFHEDAVMEWPQSGERVVGGDNRRGVYKSFPGLPTITPKRLLVSGDLVTAEATLDYGEGAVFETVSSSSCGPERSPRKLPTGPSRSRHRNGGRSGSSACGTL
jgi:ketosteroid isomerase-like protein